MRVEFHSMDDFLEELELNREAVRSKVVRATFMVRYGSPVNIRYLIAGFVVEGTNELFYMKHEIGQYMAKHDYVSNGIPEKEDAARDRLTKKVKELGLQLRGG